MWRRCPFTGCPNRIDPSWFGCSRHWHSLSKSDQARVYDAWRRYQDGAIDIVELRRIQQEVLGTRGTVGE